MNFGIPNLTNYAMSYINQQSRTVGQNSSVDFNSVLSTKKAENIEATDARKVEEYTKYLQSKYGNVAIQNIGKDQASLDRIGKSMSGHDVIIAPNILEQMANDPEKATYYEKKIDDFFDAIPSLNVSFASKGLTHEPGGVVIHENGSVTYVGGCSDSPERVAEVNRINKEKKEKEIEQRKESLERSQEVTEQRRKIIEHNNQKQILNKDLNTNTLDSKTTLDTSAIGYVVGAVSVYENIVDAYSESIIKGL